MKKRPREVAVAPGMDSWSAGDLAREGFGQCPGAGSRDLYSQFRVWRLLRTVASQSEGGEVKIESQPVANEVQGRTERSNNRQRHVATQISRKALNANSFPDVRCFVWTGQNRHQMKPEIQRSARTAGGREFSIGDHAFIGQNGRQFVGD